MTNLQDLLAPLPGMVFYKNKDLEYYASSLYTAKLCGFDSLDEFYGSSDFELRCSAVQSAEQFRREDQRVMACGKTLTCLQVHQYADERLHIFLVKKSPVMDEFGQVGGVCAIGSEITNPAIGHVIYNLMQNREPMQEYQLLGFYEDLSLRESELLFYFMRGFTNKEIGSYLSISPRTVETYLERIKIKFRCSSRSELLAYCSQYGLMYIIPKAILRHTLNTSVAWW